MPYMDNLHVGYRYMHIHGRPGGSRSWRGKGTGKSIDTLITCSYKNGVVPDVLFLIGETEINKGESLVTAIEGKHLRSPLK